LRRFFRWLFGAFRRSLQLRYVAITVILSGIALVAVGGFLSYSIGSGLYTTRQQQILAESERAVIDVQNTFAASGAADEVSLQTLMNSVVPDLESNISNSNRQVALLRSPGQSGSISLQSPISSSLDPTVIPDDLRTAVRASAGHLVYRSVGLPVDGQEHPGIVVGAQVQVPVAGTYELYLVYDLQSEQTTLDFVQGTLVFGGLVLIPLIGAVSLFVTGRIVRPVKVAAAVSEALADGDLSGRLPQTGEDVMSSLARSFNRMAESMQTQIDELSRLSEMQQRFVSDVSHELRTPMTTIKLAGELIFNSRESMDPMAKRSAELLQDQIERFESLLSDLLEMSRYDAGAVNAEFEVQDLNGVVGMAIASVEPLAFSRSTEIEIDIPSGPVEVEMDARRIDRVLRNLLANAIEHGDGNPIVVRVAQNQSAVAVSVTDHGVGMTEEQLQHVFDRFWRADPSRKRTSGGTGLGLAISLEDAHIHHGWLEVASKFGEGSTFRLTLPKRNEITVAVSPLSLGEKGWNRGDQR
jgi:two-component system sensor histidine kinase MtrB